jgi:RNA polymerase sigma-70 factor, ECF subfamily
MNSEAVACLPNTSVSSSEVRKSAFCTSEVSPSFASVEQTGPTDNQGKLALPPSEISDESLLDRIGKGEKEAIAILFRRHARTVRNVACRILRDEAEADDLVQDIFIFIFRKALFYKASHGSARSWIVQATYHRAFNRRSYLKNRHFYTSSDLEHVVLAASKPQYEALFAEWTFEGVWGTESAARLRELLSPSQLTTIELHFFEGYTLEEIADHLGQTLGNVRNHYYRGLEKLRKPAFANKLRSK